MTIGYFTANMAYNQMNYNNALMNSYLYGQYRAMNDFQQASMAAMPRFTFGDPGPEMMDYPMIGGSPFGGMFYNNHYGGGCSGGAGLFSAGFALGNLVGAPFTIVGSACRSIFG